jgi:hypothetical protein
VQADELRVKNQGGIVGMALAMMVKTRLWLGGEVSEQRDLPLIRRLIKRVRRCAAHRPLLGCTDGLVSYIRAMRETFRDPVYMGKGGRPRLRPWRHVLLAQVIKRYERRRVGATERLAPLARRCRALARHTLTLHEGMFLVGTVYNFCTPHESLSQAQQTTPAMAAGITDHCWTMHELLSFYVPLSRWAPPKRRGRPSRALQHLIERWCS